MKLRKIFLAMAVLSTLLIADSSYKKDGDLKDCKVEKTACEKECNKNKNLYADIKTCYSICKTNYAGCSGMAYEEEKLYTKD